MALGRKNLEEVVVPLEMDLEQHHLEEDLEKDEPWLAKVE